MRARGGGSRGGGLRGTGDLRGGLRAVLAVAVGAGGGCWGGGGAGIGLVMAVVLAEMVTPATLGNLLLQLLRENDARHLHHTF